MEPFSVTLAAVTAFIIALTAFLGAIKNASPPTIAPSPPVGAVVPDALDETVARAPVVVGECALAPNWIEGVPA